MSANKRVMILPSPPSTGSIGSTTKCIGIARSLKKRGCEVGFVMGEKLAGLISQNGFKVYPYPSPTPKGVIQNVNNIVDFIEWTGMAEEGFVESSIAAELEAIRDFKPDAIFAEARPSASITAKIAGIPSVMIASWPCHPGFPANAVGSGQQYVQPFNRQLKYYKLPEVENVTELFFMRADIKLAPTLPELEPELQPVEGVQFTGYILDLDKNESHLPAWYESWDKRKQIFIYLSVSAMVPALYMEIITQAFKDTPYRVICGCGYHYDLKYLPCDAHNVRFERYIPAAAVMRDTSLVIFHGGQDTMLTALLHGLPAVTVPGKHYERVYNSERLVELGAAKMLQVHAFRPGRLKNVVEEVLNGSYASESRRLSEKLQGYRGTEECVDALIKAAGG